MENELSKKWGRCCDELKHSLENATNGMIAEDQDILWLVMGYYNVESHNTMWLEHVLFYCPFCSTQLQDKKEVEKRLASIQES